MRSGDEKASQTGRNAYFDALRVLAILLVIFNHLPGYSLYQTCAGPKAWLYMLITMLTRINVPLFLMVSGALTATGSATCSSST